MKRPAWLTSPPPAPREPDQYDRPGLPSGTVLRFALLAIAVLVGSLEMSNTLLALLFSEDGTGLGCWFAVGDDSAFWRDALAGRASGTGRACLTEPVPGQPYAGGLWGTGAVLVTAIAVYYLLPAARARRRGLVPVEQLGPAFDPVALRAELAGLIRTAFRVGDPEALPMVPPRFVVDCGALDASAVVFGRMRDPVVCLHAGLLVVRRTAPEKFRAVVLHELAHIRTFDVGLAYFTLALWRAFACLVLVPYAVVVGGAFVLAAVTGHFPGIDGEFWPAAAPELVRQTAKALVLVAVILLARADTLRHRELVADAEAVASGADPGVWEDAALGPTAAAADDAGRQFAAHRLRALLRPHPSWQARLLAVRRPITLHTLDHLQYFLVGCTALIAVNTVGRVWGEFLWMSVAAGTSSGIILLATWHQLLAARTGGSPPPSGLSHGLAFGCGLVVGQFTAGVGTTSRWWPTHPALPLLILLMPAAMAVLVAWITQCGHLAMLQNVRPRAALAAMTIVAWLAGLSTVIWWQTDGYAALAGHPVLPPLRAATEAVPVGQTATVLAAAWIDRYLGLPRADGPGMIGVALWAYPVLVQLPRFFGGTERRDRTRWAMEAEGASFRGALAAGTVGGLASCAAIAALAFAAPQLGADSGLPAEGRQFLLTWWTAGAFWAGGVLAAVLAALRTGPVWLPRALTAGAVAQTLASLGFLAVWGLGGCGGLGRGALRPGCGRLDPGLWNSLPALVNLIFATGQFVALAALLTAMAVRSSRAIARRTARRRRNTVGPRTPRPLPLSQPTSPSWRPWAPRAGLGLLLALAVASCHAHQEITEPPDPLRPVVSDTDRAPSLATADRIRSLQLLFWSRTAYVPLRSVVENHEDTASIVVEHPRAPAFVRDSCERLRTAVTTAERAVTFPKQSLGTEWKEYLRQTADMARSCLTWSHSGTTSPAPQDLSHSYGAGISLLLKLDQIAQVEQFWR
ncbi:M48 family metalloprotease [Streptomyces sp. NPDC056549]|uniref:M48 family metalloprotease n=1 Tax=Streptomyces sp. NPDC056549 TaxID=3345864 RepID=UPI0036AFE53C